MFLVYLVSFIMLGLVILLGSHYLAFLSLAYFFSIDNQTHRNIFMEMMLLLSVSFIIATLLTNLKENFLTRALYFLTGFWMGFFINLFMTILVTWLIVDVTEWLNIDINTKLIAFILILAAFVYSLYGVWNSRHPRIKNITVTIPNLPDAWQGKRIIQLSDIHIGHINRRDFVDDVAKKANSVDPEMVVITGDIFDGMDGDLDSPVRLINNLKSKKGTYFVTGNHETYLGLDQVSADISKTKAVFLHDEVKDIDGLKLIGINYPDRTEKKNMLEVLEKLKPQFQGQPNIFLYHSPTKIDQVKNSGVNLELCGHTHAGQIFPINYITKLIYKGYDYGLHQIGDYTLYTTSGTGSWGPPLRTGIDPEIVVITLK